MNFKIAIFITTLLLIFNNSYAAQDSSKTNQEEMKRAVADYKTLRYSSAITKLKPIVEKDSSNIAAIEMLANSYRMIKNYSEALKWYEKLNSLAEVKKDWVLHYAEVLANEKLYERSTLYYRKYLKLVPNDKRSFSFVNMKLNALDEARENWKISFTNINSAGSDYAPVFYKEGLLFSSNRKENGLFKRVFLWDNTPFTNIYTVAKLKDIKNIDLDSLMGVVKSKSGPLYRFNDDDTEQTSNDSKTLGIYNPSLNRDSLGIILSKDAKIELIKGKINSKYHEGSAAISPDGSVFFTRNNFNKGVKNKSSEGINKLKIYIASGENLRKISEFTYNNDEYSVGQPALNKAGNIIVFVSDMLGGFGGTDLYYSVRSGNGNWTKPVNMGKYINTEGDEMFPYLHNDNTLVFSSTGHAGLGGLDLFEVNLKEMKPIGVPKNLGSPVNSSADDFALIKANDGKSGYFSTNRTGNDNIFHFSRSTHLITLRGTVKDFKTDLPLAGTRILLRTLDGVDTLRAGPRGEFTKELLKETDYELIAQKLGYANVMLFTSTVGIDKDSVINLDIKLRKAENKEQWVMSNCDSLKKVFSVGNIYYDLDRSDILYDARPTLDYIVNLMNKYPEITIITSSHCDSRASEDYNKKLSLRRGNDAKKYLIEKGISAQRIRVEYYGKTRLVNRCYDGVQCSEEEQRLNRRTEFDIILNGVNLTQLNCNDLN